MALSGSMLCQLLLHSMELRSTPFNQKSKKQFTQLAENQSIHTDGMVANILQPACLNVRELTYFPQLGQR